MTHVWTDQELYQALGQQGAEEQRQAFEVLYRELYAIALYMVQTAALPDPQAVAQDCTQEAIVKIWRHLEQCTQPDALRRWAKTIVRNQTLNELARLKRKRETPLEQAAEGLVGETLATPTGALAAAERFGAILDLLAAAPLSERSRFVILAKYLMQMTEEEIAGALSAREGGEVRPSHVQVTRSKNFKKIYTNPDLRARFGEL
jgi:RNA polymerase sigma factor (sigma-70 family)